MNWVGGSRTRVLIKQERRKQKEYFERNRLKSKMKLLRVLSPVKNSTVSLDLLNLYMVNQISCKKKTPEHVKKPVHVNMNKDIKIPIRKHDLELQMLPNCTPSKLYLDDKENNIHYQEPSSKEELGPVQSSQDMNSYNMFGPQFHRTESYRYSPLSLSAACSSNRHIPKQNSTPRIVPRPWKGQTEQLSDVSYSDSFISQLTEGHYVLSSSHKTAQFGTLFERSQSPGNGDFLTETSAIIRGEDCGSLDKRRKSDFITGKQSVQHIWGDNGKEFSSFIEDVNQPTHKLLSENHDSSISQNMISLLNIDQQRIKEMFDKCRYGSLGDICVVATSSHENHSTDGCTRGIFTVPETTFSGSTFNKTNYQEKCHSNKNYQKEYNNNEINDLRTSFEKDCYPANSERKGKLENGHQEKLPKNNAQEHPVNSMGAIPLEELYPKQSWDLGLDEIVMEEERICSSKERPIFIKKICLDSSQGSQSASYSPKPTDSSFSSSSDMLSEDEDQILQQTEDSNKISMKTTETANDFYVEKMGKHLDDKIKDNAKIHKQNGNFDQFSVKNNTDRCPQCHCNSVHILQNKANTNCVLQAARCDAGVQTEREPVVEEKLDVAIQCDNFRMCMEK